MSATPAASAAMPATDGRYPLRQDRFAVGDEVWWHIPTVMACCRSWAPDITKPTKIIAVRDKALGPDGKLHNSGHTQLVRVSPNYCPFGDEFEGTWLLPAGVKSHNDPEYWAKVRGTGGTP